MNKDDLRELLAQPYKFNNWKKVVDFVFPNVSYLQTPVTIPTEADLVESFRQVGSVRMNDGKNLALFEVHVKPNVNIARNRVALRNLVAGYIDQERNHGILAIYEKGTDEYRFTYTAKETDYDEEKGDFVKKETATKRFTYILGANETCRTARDRFWELSQHKEEATIQDVENAFSVEKLSKEFFAKYKSQYTAFVDYLTTSNFKISAFNADEKAIRDFVKKMLGRIVFLQFVQKKRWLGASDTHYQDGDKQFMNHFWSCSERNEAFYSVHLTKLFFDALNKNHRTNDSFEMPDSTIVCVPHLGGGLFEKDREDPEWLTFPPALFENLFSFFSEYNFTIDENDSHENEVGIDPEMLGQIFENLLEDNKDKGAFYTPKPIVKYMCQQSLIQYLLNAFEKKGIFTNEAEKQELEEKLGHLVKKYEAHEVIEYDRILAQALYNVKICDPAIGSGAFPMGILNEMMMIINVLHNATPDVVEDIWDMENWQPATVKKHIIQNSIYGVDIEKGAVDIARLRFWLSLIIDEEKPCNLPSLDYKIVVGNSLISKFEDEVIDIDWEIKEEATQGNLFGDENEKAREELLKIISQKQITFFTAENREKEKLKLEIRKLKIDLLINQLQLQIKKQGLEKVQSGSKGQVLKRQTEQYLKTQGWKIAICRLENLKMHPEKPFNHFDWRLDIPEILNPEIVGTNAGFDIVIGNPPYVKEDINKDAFKGQKHKECYQGKMDLWYLFGDLGLTILKENGHLCFIATNNWVTNAGASNFRNIIVKSSQIINLTDFGAYMIFENASVQTMIMLFKKTQYIDNYTFDYRRLQGNNLKEENVTDLLLRKENNVSIFLNPFVVKDNLLNNNFIFNSDENSKLLEKIKAKHNFFIRVEPNKELGIKTEFGNGIDVMQDFVSKSAAEKLNGIAKIGDGVFVISQDEYNGYDFSEEEKEILKPYFTTKQLSKYFGNPNNTHWIIYTKSDINKIDPKTKKAPIENYPVIKHHLDKFKKIITSAFGPYGLNRAREQYHFEGNKILAQRKCPKEPIFTYTNFDCYVSRAFLIIQSDRINLKYLTGILNSKLIAFWLRHKGKLQGNQYQIDKEPLLQIPLHKANNESPIAKIVSRILGYKSEGLETEDFEKQIDIIVYKLYELTYDEVLVVDPAFALTESEYNDFSMEEDLVRQG